MSDCAASTQHPPSITTMISMYGTTITTITTITTHHQKRHHHYHHHHHQPTSLEPTLLEPTLSCLSDDRMRTRACVRACVSFTLHTVDDGTRQLVAQTLRHPTMYVCMWECTLCSDDASQSHDDIEVSGKGCMCWHRNEWIKVICWQTLV